MRLAALTLAAHLPARYMNVPRMVDHLLERAGSRRFFARGETSEPHTPLGLEMVSVSVMVVAPPPRSLLVLDLKSYDSN